jgi:hypothetical protein
MLIHGLSKLVTENSVDFSDFSEVETIDLPGLFQKMKDSIKSVLAVRSGRGYNW